jgi:hypothetical protein
MDEVLEFTTTHRMKTFINESVIVVLVNRKWSHAKLTVDFVYFVSDFLNPYQYQNTFVQCFLIPFCLIHVVVCVLPLVLLFSSLAPVWFFWTFQVSYLT